jgi:hypothetical protein
LSWHLILLLLHNLCAVALLGASTHAAWLALRAWLRGKPPPPRLEALYARVIAWAFPLTFGLGLWIYPRFRVGVRADYLDAAHPWAVALFEVKEHWAVLAGLTLLGWRAAVTARDPAPASRYLPPLLVAAAVWLAALTGWLLTALRPL